MAMRGSLLIGIATIAGLLASGNAATAGKPPAGCTGDVLANKLGTYPTIQSCIDNKAVGPCLVCDGTYIENIDFHGKNVTVKSINGAAKTTLTPAGVPVEERENKSVPVFYEGSREAAKRREAS